MSKVKIQGHASGTGVLTVTAPNTSTDRTITLPDGTGTLLTADGDGSSLTGVGVSGISSSADATAITIDSAENVGFGVTPSAFHNSYTGLNVGKTGTLLAHTSDDDGIYIGSNSYYSTAGNYKYIMDGKAAEIKMDADAAHFKFRTAASGTAGNAITWTDRLEITDDGRGLSQFTAKAWANWNGTGTPAFRDSHNCSSLTDVSTGNYRVNFSNNMANTNYCPVANGNAENTWAGAGTHANGIEVAYVAIYHVENNTSTDTSINNVLVFGD